jgi:Ca-activated chloride channel family protein
MPWGDVTFAEPGVLLLLLAIPALVFLRLRRQGTMTSDYRYTTLEPFRSIGPTWRERLRPALFALRMFVLAALIVALARPRSVSRREEIVTEGIDIVLVVDVSGSMLAEDFQPNRIEAAKAVAVRFVDGRVSDRIGLVVFAAESFTQCPLTVDYRILKRSIEEVRSGLIEDGTAVGMAVANGVNRLRESEAKSRVMILLTDGVNNRGEIDPLTAAQIAAEYGIRIYTVAVGTRGTAPYPVRTPFGIRYRNIQVEVDEGTLRQVAETTGGRFFRATDNASLEEIYREIDRLEKTKIEVRAYRRYREHYPAWVGLGLLLLALEAALSGTVLSKIP